MDSHDSTDAIRLIDIDEAAKMLAVSPGTMRKLTRRGELACVRIGHSVRYDVGYLRQWVDAHTTKTSSDAPNG